MAIDFFLLHMVCGASLSGLMMALVTPDLSLAAFRYYGHLGRMGNHLLWFSHVPLFPEIQWRKRFWRLS